MNKKLTQTIEISNYYLLIMPSLPMIDFNSAIAIERLVYYYVMFSTLNMLVTIIRFFYETCFSPDKDHEIRELKAEVENLHNILEEVITFVTRNRNNYDEEKAEFVEPVEKTEEKPVESNEAKED